MVNDGLKRAPRFAYIVLAISVSIGTIAGGSYLTLNKQGSTAFDQARKETVSTIKKYLQNPHQALARFSGFVTFKSIDMAVLTQRLRQQNIAFEEISMLGLVRIKQADFDRINSSELSSLIHQSRKEVLYHILRTPNDPQYPSQSYLGNIQATTAWDVQTGTSNVTVAVLDTGVMGSHPDLSGKMTAGYDYINNRELGALSNSDDEGHGTLIAGVIGATSDNGVGVAGIDWGNRIMPIKVINAAGVGTDTNVALGLRYAVDHGAHIVNMSFGGAFSQTLKDQIDYAWSKGTIMIAAAGNTGTETTLYPAGWDEVLSVGSVSASLARSSFSTYGNYLDVVAPGESVVSTNSSGGYSSASGTSLAAPFVSATASLLRAQSSSVDKSDVFTAIKSSARDIDAAGRDKFTGSGLLQIRSALDGSNLYHYQYAGQSPYPQIAPGQAAQLTLILKNTGNAIWRKGTVNLATDRNRDRTPGFIRESGTGSPAPSGWLKQNRITMQETSVAPGGNGTFVFWIQAPSTMAASITREYFRPVADGITWMEDYGIYWDVKVLTDMEQHKHSFVSQNSYPTISKNSAYKFQVTVKNTGTKTWARGRVNLGTDRPQDRIPSFVRESNNGSVSGWISPNRIQFEQSSVAPGETATYSFWLRNDGVSSGVHKQYFKLVADGVGWMDDLGIYWDVTVP